MAKVFTKSLLSFFFYIFNKVVKTLKSSSHAPPPPPMPTTSADNMITRWSSESDDDDEPPANGTTTTVLCKVEGGLLMSPSTFPYFMLAALESGGLGLIRAILLLLMYPALILLGHDRAIRAMAMVSFAGVSSKDGGGAFRLMGRAVMPKLLLEDVSAEVFDAAVRRRRRRVVCVSGMPREMVEPFLNEYLGVDAVVAPEMRAFGGYCLGVMESDGEVMRRLDMEEVIGGGDEFVVGIGGHGRSFRQLFDTCCKPLVFHDGRTAFRPTPSATLAMFAWLPLSTLLAVLRAAVFLLLPFSLSVPLLAALGMHSRRITTPSSPSPSPSPAADQCRLFVSNHRSIVDALYISAATGRDDLAAATYGISRLSEILSPIRTFRLTRRRAADLAAMRAHLSGGGGGLVVCPEGTTCREPYLLRFSPLFTELGADVQPVALHSEASMFHGTTAGGRKLLDPLFLLMNPTLAYVVQFLEPVAVSGGGPEMANEVQRRIGEALEYTCTALTRRDKYLALTGNDGRVGTVTATNKKIRS
uniref:Phospholipid/glycerol acyltransferase domain-containing protein n=1 Tax=Leersia perrieri TaxID=77586 RepID=A0A0D9V0D4_9ORYZ